MNGGVILFHMIFEMKGMKDLLKAFNSNFASKRQRFQLKYRSKKDGKDSYCDSFKTLQTHKRGPYSFLSKMKSSEQLLTMILD